MLSFLKHLSTSASGMSAQSTRLRFVSENIANYDTPGYRRKLATFGETVDKQTGAQLVEIKRLSLDKTPPREVYDPSNPLADPETGKFALSNVDLMVEVADAREAQRSFEANMKLFDQARKMYGGVLDLLRR